VQSDPLRTVTGAVDYPAAVLIRGVDGIVGPGRLTKAIGIDGTLDGQVANKELGVWFSEGTTTTAQSDNAVSENWC
jgi:DNA-3-methyladenine glycosylase